MIIAFALRSEPKRRTTKTLEPVHTMVTQQQPGKPATEAIHRVWKVAAIPLMGVGLALWISGIVADHYWLIVSGTLTIALGAYKVTDR